MSMTGNPGGEGRGREGLLYRPHRFVGYFLISLAILCFLPQCGLGYIPFLSEPLSLFANDADKTFQFKRTSDNTEAEFLGFEIYYKFYTESVEPDNTIITYSALSPNGFSRLSSSDDLRNHISKPLIKIPFGNTNTITFTLDFNQVPEKDPETSSTDLTVGDVSLRRSVYYDSDQGTEPDHCKHFPETEDDTPETYEDNDNDIDSSVWTIISTAPTSDNVKLALYVLSYGLENYTLPLHSDALYLGYITVNFGW